MERVIGLNPSTMISVNTLQHNNRCRTELCYILGREDTFYIRKTYSIDLFYDRNNCVNNIEYEFNKVYDISNLNTCPDILAKYVGYCRNDAIIMIARQFVNGSSMYSVCDRIHQYNHHNISTILTQLLTSNNFICNNDYYNYNIHYNNVFLNDLNVKITDWGNECMTEALERSNIGCRTTNIFKDPYLYQTGKNHGKETIIYLIGLIIYSLCANKRYKIRRFPRNDILPEYTIIQDLVYRMINSNPIARPNTEQITAFLLANQ